MWRLKRSVELVWKSKINSVCVSDQGGYSGILYFSSSCANTSIQRQLVSAGLNDSELETQRYASHPKTDPRSALRPVMCTAHCIFHLSALRIPSRELVGAYTGLAADLSVGEECGWYCGNHTRNDWLPDAVWRHLMQGRLTLRFSCCHWP